MKEITLKLGKFALAFLSIVVGLFCAFCGQYFLINNGVNPAWIVSSFITTIPFGFMIMAIAVKKIDLG